MDQSVIPWTPDVDIIQHPHEFNALLFEKMEEYSSYRYSTYAWDGKQYLELPVGARAFPRCPLLTGSWRIITFYRSFEIPDMKRTLDNGDLDLENL